MGCGISRFDSRLHDHDHDRVDGDGREDHSTKNNHGGKGRLLFVKSSTNGGGGEGCRRSVSSHPYNKSLSPINHIASQQHHRCHERPNRRNSGDIENKNIVERENNNLNNYGRDAEEDEDEKGGGGGRKCISKDNIDNDNNNNGDEMEGSSIMFRGSPSFREYCRPEDQINTNTNDKEEEEEMMRKKTVVGVRTRRENIKNKGSGSGGVALAAAVKRRVRRLRKVSPNHSPTTTTQPVNQAHHIL